VPHPNAPLTELGRLRLARAIVEGGWPVARAAERFQVCRATACRWAERYRDQGPAGMADRSSRPHHSPRRTPAPVVRKIVHLRWKQRLGPAQIAPRIGLATSTVYAILVRCRISRLAQLDRATGQPIRRYEHERPGQLVHIDVKKLGNIPAGVATGSWAAPPGDATARPTAPVASAAAITTPASVRGSSTPPSMIIPGWPMPRSTLMRPARPQPGSCSGPTSGSPAAAWSSSGS
jgi:transposase-like protein